MTFAKRSIRSLNACWHIDGSTPDSRDLRRGKTLLGEKSKGANQLRIFLSYSRKDAQFADQIAIALEALGHDVLIDRKGIHAAENWQHRLGEMIAEADTVVFLLSPSSIRSEVCNWEVERASELNKRMIPSLISPLGGKNPHHHLQSLNYIGFFEDPRLPGSGWGAGLAQLSAALTVNVEWIREHTRLTGLARRWEAGGRHLDLLIRGSEIVALRLWRDSRPANAPALTELQYAFLEASENFEDERRIQEYARLKEIEVAQDARAAALIAAEAAMALAEDAHRKRARWRNLLFAVVLTATATSGWLLNKAAEREQKAQAYLSRAEASEKSALAAETEAKLSGLRASINEFTASIALLEARNPTRTDIESYLETGTALGFALIRNDRTVEAYQHLTKFRADLDKRKLDTGVDSIEYYRAIVDLAISISETKQNDELEATQIEAILDSLSRLKDAPHSPAQSRRWLEDVFRGYHYAVTFSIERGDFRLGYQLASEIDQIISNDPALIETLPRIVARSKGQLSWSAILDHRAKEAMDAAIALKTITERFNIFDLNDININYAHALLINGKLDESSIQYDQFEPKFIKEDFSTMLKSGYCFDIFIYYHASSPECNST
jgi:hypothetical protein